MPMLIYSSEKFGSGATIELDNNEICIVSCARVGVRVRTHKKGALLGAFLGAILYHEKDIYKAAKTAQTLDALYPDYPDDLAFNNPVLKAFANAVWHCSSAAEVCAVLNEALEKAPQLANAVEDRAIERAFKAAQDWRPLELTSATYRVIYSDGVGQDTRLTPEEINRWVAASNKQDEGKPYRIIQVVDSTGAVVWPSSRKP
jgi:hypothetical protein